MNKLLNKFCLVLLASLLAVSTSYAKSYDVSALNGNYVLPFGMSLPITRKAYGHQFHIFTRFDVTADGNLQVTSPKWVESIPAKCSISESGQGSGDHLTGQADVLITRGPLNNPRHDPGTLTANNITILKGDIACYEVEARERAAEAAIYTDSKVTEVREDMEQFIQEMRGTVDSQVRHYLSAGILTNTVTDVILREFNVMRQAVMQVLRAMREEKLYDTFLPDNQHFLKTVEPVTVDGVRLIKLEDLRGRDMFCDGQAELNAYIDPQAEDAVFQIAQAVSAKQNEWAVELELKRETLANQSTGKPLCMLKTIKKVTLKQ